MTANRKEALAAGAKTYDPGKPCRAGHACERYVSNWECVECVRLKNAAHYEANKPTHAERNRQWKRDHRARNCANVRRREAAQMRATPRWVGDEEKRGIEMMYEVARVLSTIHGEEFHVDHVVPLQGKTVSGLHVLANLQVIHARVNRQKYNRLAP